MKFASIRDLRQSTAKIRQTLEQNHEVVVTHNGEPFAVLTPTGSDTLERDLRAIRTARFQRVLDEIHEQARAAGLDKLTMEEIDAIIAEVRAENRDTS